MLVKKGKKVYQVRFKHKKIQTGSGVQDYLMAYLVALSVLETRKLLKFLSAYARAPDRKTKKKLFQQYKDVLFSMETLEDPVIGILLKGMSNVLSSSKKTDNVDNDDGGDDSQSIITSLTDKVTKTVTQNVSTASKKINDLYRKFFNLKPTDEPHAVTSLKTKYLEKQRKENTVGSDPPGGVSPDVANPDDVNDVKERKYTIYGNQVGAPTLAQRQAKKEESRNQQVDLPQLSPEVIEAMKQARLEEQQKLESALEASFLDFDINEEQKQAQERAKAQKQAQVKKGKEVVTKLQKQQANAAKARVAKAEKKAQKKAEKTGQEGEGLKDFLNKSLSSVKNNIKNITPKLIDAIITILKYYIAYEFGRKVGIVQTIISRAPEFKSMLSNKKTILDTALEINEKDLISKIMDKIKIKSAKIYNFVRPILNNIDDKIYNYIRFNLV